MVLIIKYFRFNGLYIYFYSVVLKTPLKMDEVPVLSHSVKPIRKLNYCCSVMISNDLAYENDLKSCCCCLRNYYFLLCPKS